MSQAPAQFEQLQARVEFLERQLTAAHERRRRAARVVTLMALVALPFVARQALAAGCPRTGAFLYLPGLQYFCAEDPAVADEVNANTQAIVSAVEQKVGQLGNTNVSVPGNLSVTGTFSVGFARSTSYDGCYFATCPTGTAPVFANVTCPAGVRVGSSNASGNRWYADCGTSAACTTFIEAWCSRVLR